MDWKLILTAFGTLFLAELGDKTQLATLGLAAKTGKPLPVFLGAASALVLITLLAVLFGDAATRVVPVSYLRKGAAGAFILIGILMLVGKI
jgi:putative Ca2+/H+ antiporter (TMEM165/GDT1 family)